MTLTNEQVNTIKSLNADINKLKVFCDRFTQQPARQILIDEPAVDPAANTHQTTYRFQYLAKNMLALSHGILQTIQQQSLSQHVTKESQDLAVFCVIYANFALMNLKPIDRDSCRLALAQLGKTLDDAVDLTNYEVIKENLLNPLQSLATQDQEHIKALKPKLFIDDGDEFGMTSICVMPFLQESSNNKNFYELRNLDQTDRSKESAINQVKVSTILLHQGQRQEASPVFKLPTDVITNIVGMSNSSNTVPAPEAEQIAIDTAKSFGQLAMRR